MKKLFGIILCAVLLITAAVPAFAAAELDNSKLNIVISGGLEDFEAVPGEEIDVKIELKNNTGISSAKILLTYDKKLSVVKDDKGEAMITFDIFDSTDDSAMKAFTLYEEDGQILLNWLTALGEVSGDVVFATIKFKVSDEPEAVGAFLPIGAEIDPDDVYNINVENVDFNLISGGVKVKEKGGDILVGDCNGDGSLDNKDVVALFRHVSGNTPDNFNVEASDFNGDGEVDNKDVVTLFRYVSTL